MKVHIRATWQVFNHTSKTFKAVPFQCQIILLVAISLLKEVLQTFSQMTVYYLPILMHSLLFIHKILFSSTCFKPQVLIFRRIQLYTRSIWYCHSHREWQYHMLSVYNCILLKMSTWGLKHVEENSILCINNNQCIKVGN